MEQRLQNSARTVLIFLGTCLTFAEATLGYLASQTDANATLIAIFALIALLLVLAALCTMYIVNPAFLTLHGKEASALAMLQAAARSNPEAITSEFVNSLFTNGQPTVDSSRVDTGQDAADAEDEEEEPKEDKKEKSTSLDELSGAGGAPSSRPDLASDSAGPTPTPFGVRPTLPHEPPPTGAPAPSAPSLPPGTPTRSAPRRTDVAIGQSTRYRWWKFVDNFEPNERKILDALSSGRYLWRSFDSLQKRTNLSSKELSAVLDKLMAIQWIRATISRDGDPIYGLSERVGNKRG